MCTYLQCNSFQNCKIIRSAAEMPVLGLQQRQTALFLCPQNIGRIPSRNPPHDNVSSIILSLYTSQISVRWCKSLFERKSSTDWMDAYDMVLDDWFGWLKIFLPSYIDEAVFFSLEWASKNIKSSAVTCPPNRTLLPKSTACAFSRPMRSLPSPVSGIS